MMDSKVLFPEPDAPTIAAVSRGASEKSISRRMVKVPVESLTDLKTCSTETIEEGDDVAATLPLFETTGTDMNALSKNLYLSATHFNKPAQAPPRPLLKPFAALLIGAGVLLTLAAPAKAQTAVQAATPKTAVEQTLLIVGDSLSAEYGLKRGTGWVSLLEKELAGGNKPVKVVNASISGDTTSGGVSRLPALLKRHKPATVVLELGGNDALRGLPLNMTEKNLTTMTLAAKKAGAKVLLIGMQVPPNYGSAYAKTFSGLFAKVAEDQKVAVAPFFLKGIADADDPTAQFQADRIHPNEQSQAKMLANVLPDIQKLIR